jgi:hypothetical protein
MWGGTSLYRGLCQQEELNRRTFLTTEYSIISLNFIQENIGFYIIVLNTFFESDKLSPDTGTQQAQVSEYRNAFYGRIVK